jgi:hypothetical protein
MQRTDERPLDDLTLLVYPGAPGACTVYEDDGRSQAFRDGQFGLTEIRSSFDDGVVRVEVGAVTGAYAGQPSMRDLTVRVRCSDTPTGVQVRRRGREVTVGKEGTDPSAGSVAYLQSSEPGWISVRVPTVERSESVTVQLSR